ncbi:MAG: hypothetical protein KGO53_04315 [Alphaproteobacteria bacterium]|nr:hypothetical protein [Alphaproteobacteria bacterium]
MTDYLILFLIVFGVNLMPAFGPPTWTIIALYVFNSNQPVPATVAVGALAAASGRYILARVFRHLGGYLPENMRRNLKGAREAIEQRRRSTLLALGLFALSPIPSAQLFEAAGLAGVRLFQFTAAFFLGRTVAYSVYALTVKSIRETTIGESFQTALTSPYGLASQLVMLILLALAVQVDWGRLFSSRPHGPE